MGTKMAPNYANLFMVNFENKFVFNYKIQPLFYKRYINDIFFVWPSTADELTTFWEHLNKSHPTIKFSFESSIKNVPFLDVDITLEDNQCYVKPYFKSTNTFSYMSGQSYHPPSVFKGLTREENIRILRNCTKQQDYKDTMDFLTERFTERKIPPDLLIYPLFHMKIENNICMINHLVGTR